MYTPSFHQFTDRQEQAAFMRRHSFALLITEGEAGPQASHLPFVVKLENNLLLLRAHFAKANRQWKGIDGKKAMVIFSGPHAYISPRHYLTENAVPTWNYVAVHAYGYVRLLETVGETEGLLRETIGTYEPDYLAQWDRLPEDYRLRMRNGIVGFEIPVSEVEGKKKLSQNRSPEEVARIISALEFGSDAAGRELAAWMKQELP